MKRIILLFIFFSWANLTFAQEDAEQEDAEQGGTDTTKVNLANLPFGIGPYLGYGLGVNLTPAPDGRKSDIALADLPDAGASIYMPLSSTAYIGLTADISFTNYGFTMIDYSTKDEYLHRFSCISFNPSILFSGFMVGYTMGIPIMADYNDSKIDKSDLNIQQGVTFGYQYQIWGDNDGRIAVSARLTYMFSNVFDDYMVDDPLIDIIAPGDIPLNNSNSPRFATFTIGFNYMFNFFNESLDTPAVE